MPYNITGYPTAPEIDGFSAGKYDVDNSTMYIGSSDNSGCGGQTVTPGRLSTVPGKAGLYSACSLGEQFHITGITYLLAHPGLVILIQNSS